MKTKIRIYRFDTMVYPRFVWVVTGGNLDDFKANFLNYREKEIQEEVEELERMGGMTISVLRKKVECYGIAIWFPDMRPVGANWIAHEAAHGAMEIFRQVGCEIDDQNQEPFAYLVGFIAECIERVKNKKADEERV